MPKDTMGIGIGNDISCSISGFLLTIGICGSVLYSISISIYFLCIAKFEMEEKNIRKYVEPFLHGVPVLYSLSTSIYVLSVNYFNPPGLFCWINPPRTDGDNGDDKNSKINQQQYLAEILGWLAGGGPIIFAFVSNCIILGLIWWVIYNQSKMMSCFYGMASAAHQPSPSRNPRRNHQAADNGQGERTSAEEERMSILLSSSLKSIFQRFKPSGRSTDQEAQGHHNGSDYRTSRPTRMPSPRRSNISNSNMSPLAARLSRPSRGTTQMLKEISNRATAYIIGYIITYIFSLIDTILLAYTGRSTFAITGLARFLLPLQGFFNLLIYTYPHMSTYRRRHAGTSLICAFWEVIKSGGDSDQVQPKRRKMPKGIRNRRTKFAKERRDSLRNEPAVLDVGENFVVDAERIRTSYNPTTHTSRDVGNQVEEEKESIDAEDSDDVNDIFEKDSDLSISPSILDYGQSYDVGASEDGLEYRDSVDDDLEYDDSENELAEQELGEIINEQDGIAVKDTDGVPPGFYDLGGKMNSTISLLR